MKLWKRRLHPEKIYLRNMTTERKQRLSDVIAKRQFDLTVVLENVFDPHNVSAVMRTCDAVGIQDIYILNNRIPPQKKWGHRSSSTASRWLTIHQFTNAYDCFGEVKKKYERVLAGMLSKDSIDVYEMDLTQPTALVFGNESFGISDELRPFIDGSFMIPQFGVIKSLNISVACAVTLYEALRQKRNAGHYNTSSKNGEEKVRIGKEWDLL